MGKWLLYAAALGVVLLDWTGSAHAQADSGAGGEAAPPTQASALRAPVSLAGSPRLAPETATARPPAVAEHTPRAAQPGFVLSVGVGTSYVALGAQAAYVIPFGSRQFSLVGGVGFVPALEEADAKVGATAGVQAGFGLRSRLLVEVGVSPAARVWKLHGVTFKYEMVYGPYAQLSYEFQWEIGLLARFGAGLHAPLTNELTWVPAVSTGIGWKF